MKRNIIGNYDSHTKEDLLNEVRLRELEGLTESSLKDEIVAKLVASDSIVPKYWKDDDSGKGKRKRKRSRGLRTLDTGFDRLTKAGSKLATAVDKGFETYRDERDKSAKKKKDGALLDFVNNVAEGAKVAQEKSGGATRDLLTIFCTKRTKKQARKAARSVSSFVPFIR